MPVVNVVNALHELLEEQHDVPVELGRALHVAAFPLLLHQVGHLPARHSTLLRQVVLVAHLRAQGQGQGQV